MKALIWIRNTIGLLSGHAIIYGIFCALNLQDNVTILIAFGIIWWRMYEYFFEHKVKIDSTQHNVARHVAKELSIPEDEVLYLLMELGQSACIATMQDGPRMEVLREWAKTVPEYKNAEQIAEIVYELWVAGNPADEITDFDYEELIDFECCAHCDQPDACSDFGCAIQQGLRLPPDL